MWRLGFMALKPYGSDLRCYKSLYGLLNQVIIGQYCYHKSTLCFNLYSIPGFQETTVFMVDPRGHFTPRLTTSPELLNVSDASTPSYESCATCTARNNSNNLDVPPHLHYPTLSSLVFDRERNVVLPSHQIANNPNAQVTPNNSLQNSTSVSRCEGCGASFNSSFSNRAIDNSMTSATSSSGDSSLRHYKAGVSLLPVTSQMDLPMSLVDKSSLTTVSGLSRTSPQLDKQEDIHLCV